MAGILANSSTQTMVAGNTSADNSVSGYVTGEQITLTVTDSAPSSVEWSQAIPSNSGASRSALSASTGSSVTFTPDVGGYYTVTANVDGTSYVLRISVASVAEYVVEGALGFQPLTDAQVTTPSSGVTQYYSSTQNGLAQKNSSGVVSLLGSSVRGFGGINLSASATTALTADTWSEISGTFTANANNTSDWTLAASGAGLVWGGDSTIVAMVVAQCAFTNGSNGDEIALGVAVAGTVIEDHGHVTVDANGDSHASVNQLVEVAPGQTVSLQIQNHTDGSDIDVNHLTATIVAIG